MQKTLHDTTFFDMNLGRNRNPGGLTPRSSQGGVLWITEGNAICHQFSETFTVQL